MSEIKLRPLSAVVRVKPHVHVHVRGRSVGNENRRTIKHVTELFLDEDLNVISSFLLVHFLVLCIIFRILRLSDTTKHCIIHSMYTVSFKFKNCMYSHHM